MMSADKASWAKLHKKQHEVGSASMIPSVTKIYTARHFFTFKGKTRQKAGRTLGERIIMSHDSKRRV